ncbi:MAG: hypothetical protein HRF52_04670 [Ignavibacterium sp.]|jgi:hypothetical protein|uniref:hypothetical protein n=1 Tax=Ignavibacterium sp. TaxID=2651167 RepID=UPI0032968F71
MADTQEIRLAFIEVTVFSDGSIRGGILTTDIETRPFEFRVTSPIKPTQVQQILYGASLKDYVYGELICAPLVKATKEKLSMVLAKDNYLVAMRPLVSTPVIFIQSNGSQVSDGIKPVTFFSHRNFQNELAFAQTILNPIMQKHDLLEPFERLKLALHEVHRLGLGNGKKSA